MRIVLVTACLLLVIMASMTRGLLSPLTRTWNALQSSATTKSSTSSSLSITQQQQQAQCRSERFVSVPTIANRIHLIVLVHGWMGNPSELGYLQEALEKEAVQAQEQHSKTFYVVHSAESNDGNTTDGIAAGGSRLAVEINDIIDDIVQQAPKDELRKVSLSFVGNSLGGLYARYSLGEIRSLQQPNQQVDAENSIHIQVEPKVFCTTATPHLGMSQHTYLPLPRPAEYLVANILQPTGRDLFRYTNLIERLTTDAAFLSPLQRFHKRIAYANAYQTDFQVPTTTAAFLSETDSLHRKLGIFQENSFVSLTVETPAVDRNQVQSPESSELPASSDELAQRLDALGWIKVLCDVRMALPSIPLPFPFAPATTTTTSDSSSKNEYESSELLRTYASRSNRWHAPFGHTVLVANAKNDFYAKLNAAGKPIMDLLAANIVAEIGADDE